MSTRVIPQPILSEVMRELETYNREEKLEEIAETLWAIKPKLALYFCIEFQIPY